MRFEPVKCTQDEYKNRTAEILSPSLHAQLRLTTKEVCCDLLKKCERSLRCGVVYVFTYTELMYFNLKPVPTERMGMGMGTTRLRAALSQLVARHSFYKIIHHHLIQSGDVGKADLG